LIREAFQATTKENYTEKFFSITYFKNKRDNLLAVIEKSEKESLKLEESNSLLE